MKKVAFLALMSITIFACSTSTSESDFIIGQVILYQEDEGISNNSECFILDEGMPQSNLTINRYKDTQEYSISDIGSFGGKKPIWRFFDRTTTNEYGAFIFERTNKKTKYETQNSNYTLSELNCPEIKNTYVLLKNKKLRVQLDVVNPVQGEKVYVRISNLLGTERHSYKVDIENVIDSKITFDLDYDIAENVNYEIVIEHDQKTVELSYYSGEDASDIQHTLFL